MTGRAAVLRGQTADPRDEAMRPAQEPERALAAILVALPLLIAALLAVHPLAPLVLVALAAAAWLFLRPTRTLLLLVIAYFPLHIYLFGRAELSGKAAAIGPFTVIGMGKDLLLLLVLASWIFGVVSGRERPLRRSAATAALLALLGWAAVHVVNFRSLSLGVWGFRNYAEYAALFFVAASAAGGPAGAQAGRAAPVRTALLVLALSAVPVTLYGAYQLAEGNLLAAIAAGVLSMQDRLAGAFGGFQATNAYAVYLLIVLLAAAGLLRTPARPVLRALLVVSAALAATSLLFTFSRRAWIAAAAGGLVLTVFARRRLPILLAVAGVAVAAVAVAPTVFAERAATLFDATSATNAGRLGEWRLVLGRVFADPVSALWGTGLGLVGPVAQEMGLPGAVSTHNAYVCILGELGLAGLTFFLAFAAAVLVAGVRAARAGSGEAATLLAIVAALLVTGLGGVTIQTFPSSAYFWLLAGFLVHLDKEDS
jgi:hypothetical protein